MKLLNKNKFIKLLDYTINNEKLFNAITTIIVGGLAYENPKAIPFMIISGLSAYYIMNKKINKFILEKDFLTKNSLFINSCFLSVFFNKTITDYSTQNLIISGIFSLSLILNYNTLNRESKKFNSHPNNILKTLEASDNFIKSCVEIESFFSENENQIIKNAQELFLNEKSVNKYEMMTFNNNLFKKLTENSDNKLLNEYKNQLLNFYQNINDFEIESNSDFRNIEKKKI